ncbi:MAG: hypothetical protein MJ239_00115 [Bacilli bacterium]|nr:hypothetical protein [Bacilli bacterium]
MEKKAIKFYDDLNDTVEYCLKDWLKIEISRTNQEKILMINGAASFLFDYTFAKENAGPDITKYATMATKFRFDPERLSKPAYLMTEKIKRGMNFEESNSPFAKYFKFISETEEYLAAYVEDNAGKMVVAYLDALISTVCEEKKDISYLKIGETLFLNLVETWRLAFLDLFGQKFVGYESYPFFLGVSEAFERIRTEIVD